MPKINRVNLMSVRIVKFLLVKKEPVKITDLFLEMLNIETSLQNEMSIFEKAIKRLKKMQIITKENDQIILKGEINV